MANQILKIDLYNYFLKNRIGNVRVAKGIQDTVYAAVDRNKLLKSFKPNYIKQAKNAGWLQEHHIRPDGKTIQAVYVLTVEKMPSKEWWKRSIEWFRGIFNKKWYKVE